MSDTEPKTMAQVYALLDATFPTATSYIAWIELNEPRRHVSVRFRGRQTIEGAASTWTDAVLMVKQAKLAR